MLGSAAMATLTNPVTVAHDGFGAYGDMAVWGGGLTGSIARSGVYLLDVVENTDRVSIYLYDFLPAFCIELNERALQTPQEYEVVMPANAHKPTTFLGSMIGDAKADYICELWAAYFDPVWYGSDT